MKEIEELECEDLVYMFYKNSYEFRKLKVKERTTDYLTVAPLDSLVCSYIIVLKNISNLENNVGIYDYCDTYISTDEHLLKVVAKGYLDCIHDFGKVFINNVCNPIEKKMHEAELSYKLNCGEVTIDSDDELLDLYNDVNSLTLPYKSYVIKPRYKFELGNSADNDHFVIDVDATMKSIENKFPKSVLNVIRTALKNSPDMNNKLYTLTPKYIDIYDEKTAYELNDINFIYDELLDDLIEFKREKLLKQKQ